MPTPSDHTKEFGDRSWGQDPKEREPRQVLNDLVQRAPRCSASSSSLGVPTSLGSSTGLGHTLGFAAGQTAA